MIDKTPKDFGNIRLPKTIIDELKALRQAYINVDNRPMTYECMLSGMLERFGKERPDVYAEALKLMNQQNQ